MNGSHVRADRGSLTVDLHGLDLQSSLEMAAWALRSGPGDVTIITGRGRHSPGGKPVVKPEVERYLNRNGYWWHYQETGRPEPCRDYCIPLRVNEGAIVVSRG